MKEKYYYVYIVTNKRNGTLYIGMTGDLRKRIWEHKNRIVDSFTSRYKINQLVYYELTTEVWVAYEREAQLKNWRRAWKLNLIETMNPEWKDLYYDLDDI